MAVRLSCATDILFSPSLLLLLFSSSLHITTSLPSTYAPNCLPACRNMTGLSVIKRPMVFTWAEIQKYPTLEARFAETLPFGFDSDRAKSCKCGLAWYPPELSVEVTKLKKKCIKRTGERWAVSSSSEPFYLAFQGRSPIGDIIAERNYIPLEPY